MAVNGIEEEEKARGMEALHSFESTSTPFFLSPSTLLSQTARSASLHLFSALLPSCSKSPFDRFLVEGFDAEQIWHQIDLQTKTLIANLCRDVKRLEANPGDIMQAVGGKSVGKRRFLRKMGEKSIERRKKKKETVLRRKMRTLRILIKRTEILMRKTMKRKRKTRGCDGGGGGIEDRFSKIKERITISYTLNCYGLLKLEEGII